MIWILLAILAHVGNGVVFIVDKSLLQTKTAIGKPIGYALYSAAFAGLAILLIPWASISITSFLLLWSLIAGVVHICALYIFFTAMRNGEPSRVVPLTGSAVPLFTILFALTFLGEQFAMREGFGIVLLLVGGMMLAMRRQTPSTSPFVRGRERRIPLLTKEGLGEVMLPVVAGLLFAAYFAVTKYIYNHDSGQFLGIFIVTRVMEAVIAIAGIVIIIRPFSSRSHPLPARKQGKTLTTSIFFIFNKSLAAGAFLLQTYAISLGSVSVVNALQGVQYAFVLIMAVIVSLFFPKLFREEVRRGALVQKVVGIILVSFGVALLV